MVKDFKRQTLIDEIAKESIIVLDFYAVWCGPCAAFEPTFYSVAEEMKGKAIFGKVNIDEHRDIAVMYHISSIPTIIIIKNSEVVWQHIGTVDSSLLKSKINSLL